MRNLLITICLILLSGCPKPEGRTVDIDRYATGMGGRGTGLFECEVFFTDYEGCPVVIKNMRVSQQEYHQLYCDDNGTPGMPVGGCSQIQLQTRGYTGKSGMCSIRGIPQTPDGCDGHGWNNEHQAIGRYGIPDLNIAVFFSYAANPPYSPVYMAPNNTYPNPDIPMPTTLTAQGPVSSGGQTAISGATASMSMMVIDPNNPPEPAYGIEWDVYMVGVYDTHAEKELEFSTSNVDSWDDIFRGIFPDRYEYLVVFPEEQDLMGKRYTVTIRSSLMELYTEIEAALCDPTGKIWIFLSDGFLPVDQTTYDTLMAEGRPQEMFDRWTPVSEEERFMYDPNMFEDPNDCLNYTTDVDDPRWEENHDPNRVIPLFLLLCDDTDEITIQFTGGGQAIADASGDWLDPTKKRLDFSGSGKLDLTDFPYIFGDDN